MSCGPIVRRVGLLFALLYAAAVGANSPNSQVAATGQGIGVAISNWTPFSIKTTFDDLNVGDGIVGPGFPQTVLPYQNTGTGVYLRGGPASNYYVTMAYEILNDDDVLATFGIRFAADTQWDVKAAASDVLHAVKKKVTSSAKSSIKKAAKDSGEDAVEAAGAADGMTEVYAALKVMEDIAKLFKALDPSYQMIFGFYEDDSGQGLTPFYDNACISKNENTPAPVNVAIVGPAETVTADNAKSFFVLSAGSVNESFPGFVDMSISPMCEYVCAAWNATSDYLDEYSQSDCSSATSGSSGLTNYDSFNSQNTCLVDPSEGPNGVAWVMSPATDYTRLVPPDSCGSPVVSGYPAETASICGPCLDVDSGEPAGSWNTSCNLESFTGTTLCADCANDESSDRVNSSCANCSNEVWNNENGTLVCDTSPPPGSWLESCEADWVYNGTADSLCATCDTTVAGVSSYSCQVCSSNTWSNVNGQLVCAASTASAASANNAAPASSLPFTSHRPQAQFASARFLKRSEDLSGVSR